MLTSLGSEADHLRAEVLEAVEVVPPGVREVLVEDDLARVVRPGHDPAPRLVEQRDADLAAELMVDVPADAERQVDLLRLQADDLLAEEVERRRVVGSRRAQQLVVALVAAEDRVGQVEEDDGRLGEVGEALVLEPPAGHQVAGGGRIDDLLGEDRALGRQVVDDRLTGERLGADAGAAVPRRALPEALGRLVGVDLGRLERSRRRPATPARSGSRAGSGAVERLGRRPDAPSSRSPGPRAGTASGPRPRRCPRRPSGS